GDARRSPATELFGPLAGRPDAARVAGDVRVNENAALTAVHTLFAREHNRIVAALPSSLSEEEKFRIARRVVSAEIQYVTYNEFLPALGLKIAPYRGYDASIDPSLTNEFSVVAYRGHSMVHGQFDVIYEKGDFTNRQLIEFRSRGIEIRLEDGRRSLQIPLTVAFGNPDILGQVGIGRFLASLSAERQYRNDEQIDNALRSVLFKIPRPGVPDPAVCGQPILRPECFSAVADLGAIDIERGRDHGMPSYNELRRAFGLALKPSFTAITGEATDRFPSDPAIDAADPIDDPEILDFVRLVDANGNPVRIGTADAEENAVAGLRRTTLAARLRAVYKTVGAIDPFVGMLSEPHLPGSEFGELQAAAWTRQFTALRDGDRFFYANDPTLTMIRSRYGISYRSTLAQIIERNTDASVPDAVFFATEPDEGLENVRGEPPAAPPAPQALPARRGDR
ncbi:MAG: peroxidase family protein, partial [Actinomycetota bacterium]